MSHYVKDIVLQFFPSIFAIFLIFVYDMELPSVWILIVINIFANPPFLYAMSFIFQKAESASTAVGFLLFLVGFLGPIAVFILTIIDDTRDIAVAIKYPLSLIPLFAVSSGIITISMRFFIALLSASESERLRVTTPEPFDDVAAGVQLKMILISIPIYWLIIAIIDSGLLFNIA